MKRSAIVAAAAVLLSTITPLLAAKDQGGQSRARPSKSSSPPIESAFNRGDAKALAACWTPGGDLVGFDGQRTEGRGQIEKRFAEFLSANKGLKLDLSIVSIHLVGDSAAVVDAVAEVSPPPARDAGRAAIHAGIAASRRPLAGRDRPRHPRSMILPTTAT